MTDEMVMLSGRVPAELKERVRHDPRDNQQVLRDALEREFATEDEAAVLNRIGELEDEMETLREQKQRREDKLSEKSEEKKRLQKTLEAIEESAAQHRDALLAKAANIPASPEHPWVRDHADELDMTPEEFANEIADHHGKEYDPFNDTDDDLRSL